MTDVARPGDVLLIPSEVTWSDAVADAVMESIKARCPGLAQVVEVPALGRPVIYREQPEPEPGLCGALWSTDHSVTCEFPAGHVGGHACPDPLMRAPYSWPA